LGAALSVYSEFAQIDAPACHCSGDPREILSPAVVRNGFTSFVEAPAETKWWLFVGQNPENSSR